MSAANDWAKGRWGGTLTFAQGRMWERGGEAENHHDAVGDGSAGERTKEPGKNLGKWPLATPLVASG